LVSFGVLLFLMLVYWTIDFDHEADGVTIKICYKASNNLLAAKVIAKKPVSL